MNYAYLTNASTKDQIFALFVLRRERRDVLGKAMLDYLANDSSETSSSSDEEDIDSIMLELACIPKSCTGTRLNLTDVSTLECERLFRFVLL